MQAVTKLAGAEKHIVSVQFLFFGVSAELVRGERFGSLSDAPAHGALIWLNAAPLKIRSPSVLCRLWVKSGHDGFAI
jgi:hypothetical protein